MDTCSMTRRCVTCYFREHNQSVLLIFLLYIIVRESARERERERERESVCVSDSNNCDVSEITL